MKDRSQWVAKKCSSFEEMREFSIEQWQKCTFVERMDAAWDMVLEAWEMKGYDPDELRFQRNVTTVKRGGS